MFLFLVVATEKKLQLRSSVVDRIKTDFLTRYPSKLVVLHEPTRDTPKTREESFQQNFDNSKVP
jgi:hypothetical protein